MCKGTGLGKPSVLVRTGGGCAIRCRDCGTLGIEYGTSYLVFERGGFLRFVDWYNEVVPRRPWGSEVQRIHLNVVDSPHLLSLDEGQARDLGRLLEAARRRLAMEPEAGRDGAAMVH